MVVRVDFDDDIEIVAIIDGGYTHLFVMVCVAYVNDSEICAIFMVVARICLWFLEMTVARIVRVLLLLILIERICLWCLELLMIMIV